MRATQPETTAKLLIGIVLFWGAIHAAPALARAAAESPPAAAAPAAVPDPQTGQPPAPKTMSAEEFTGYMHGAGAALLTLEDFLALRAAEPSLTVLDVRSPEAFAYQHIAGALNLPVTEMTEHTLPKILPDRSGAVVLVCDHSFFPTRMISMTLQAWPVLRASGYTRVYRLSLWQTDAQNGRMRSAEEIEQAVPMAGTAVNK